MTDLPFTRYSAWQYLAEVHPRLTEKKSLGRVGIFWMSASGYKRTFGFVRLFALGFPAWLRWLGNSFAVFRLVWLSS